MNLDLIFAVLFYIILIYIFYKHKKHVQVQGIIALYRTKLGLKWMDKVADKFRSFWKVVSYFSIFIGFAGMAFIFYFLIKSTFSLLDGGLPALAPVLPGVKVSGLPSLGFWHWIITLFFVAVVHEFSHGIFARVYKIGLKSSGFALFGPILAAFVEPDEKKLDKKKKKEKLAMLSAGPFSNLIFGLVFFLIMIFLMTPLQGNFYEMRGMQVGNFITGYPAENSGLETPFVMHSINNFKLDSVDSFLSATEKIKPGDSVVLETNQGRFDLVAVENPENNSSGFIGIKDFSINSGLISGKSEFLGMAVKWLVLLVFWLFVVNIGVGLFNLLPLGPVDGGRMFKVFSEWIFKDKDKAHKIYVFISLFCLTLILINLSPYIIKLLVFLAKPLMWLMGG